MKLAQHPEVIKAKQKADEYMSRLPLDMAVWTDEQRDGFAQSENEYAAVRAKIWAKIKR